MNLIRFLLIAALSPLTLALAQSSETVVKGARVTFTASAEGNPAPTFQWKLNGVDIPGAMSPEMIVESFDVVNVGRYSVTASNVAGSAESNTVAVSMAVPPSVPTIRVDVVVTVQVRANSVAP
jgi:hypothetical protein